MTGNGILQILLFFGLLLLVTRPLGKYMAGVFNGGKTFLDRIIGPVERLIYRLCGIDPEQEQHWTTYTVAMLLFNVAGMLLLYGLQRLQHLLPFNPAGLGAPSADLSFNTAVSFVTNTNWQAYSGESTLGYSVQMLGMTVQNFVSAATGIAIAIALIRGFARHSANTLGNFWVDMVRATFRVLLPISILFAIVLVWQGVPQNLSPYTSVTTVEGGAQTIAQGPVASQEAIKMFGTNGGGFFNANSAHPYENPTPLTNMLEMVALFAIGAGLTYTFGMMVGNTRQGWTLFAVMSLLFFMGIGLAYPSETHVHPAVT
ncbi:MAG: potassium-transporting ATPase subunit KdpA, partial [Candidatus Kapaibacterium sp.]